MRSTPPELLAKIGQNIQTIANNANPNMRITLARAKNAIIDSSYWTVETIREGSGLGEIAIAPRRFNPYGVPNRLYGIHIQNGRVKTLIREYPDKLKNGFIEQFDLGLGSAVAITFDGGWTRVKNRWRLITEEYPWIFWVDNLGVLWRQKWDDENTKIQISDNVNKVSAIRGWKNTNPGEQDQGLIVSYLKTDGTVWYVRRVELSDLSFTWHPPYQLTVFSGTAASVNLFLTNDYRMGFLVSNTLGEIRWFITNRSWSGMGIPSEHLTVGVTDVSVSITPIAYHDTYSDAENLTVAVSDVDVQICPAAFDISQVVISLAKREAPNKIRLTFSHDILNIFGSESSFSVTGFTVSSIAYGNTSREVVLTMVQNLPSFGVFPVIYSNGPLRVSVTSQCRPMINNFTVNATGEPPSVTENLTVAVADVNVQVLPIIYRSVYSGGENLTATVADVSVVVTKVGSNPI